MHYMHSMHVMHCMHSVPSQSHTKGVWAPGRENTRRGGRWQLLSSAQARRNLGASSPIPTVEGAGVLQEDVRVQQQRPLQQIARSTLEFGEALGLQCM